MFNSIKTITNKKEQKITNHPCPVHAARKEFYEIIYSLKDGDYKCPKCKKIWNRNYSKR